MDALILRLQSLGFEHKEYPVGWYWVLYPDAEEEKVKLAKALGFEDECWDGPPDTVFIQMNEAGTDWQYCFDAEYGPLEEHEALDVLDALGEGTS